MKALEDFNNWCDAVQGHIDNLTDKVTELSEIVKDTLVMVEKYHGKGETMKEPEEDPEVQNSVQPALNPSPFPTNKLLAIIHKAKSEKRIDEQKAGVLEAAVRNLSTWSASCMCELIELSKIKPGDIDRNA